MDFTLTEAQEELAGLARKILAERDSPWADLAAAGVLGLALLVAVGGIGWGVRDRAARQARAACDGQSRRRESSVPVATPVRKSRERTSGRFQSGT